MKTTLLQVLPAIAGNSQVRFASNFQTVLLKVNRIEINGTCWFVNFRHGNYINWDLCKSLSNVIGLVREYGNDCQVLQVEVDGNVVEL